jgi:hypothetical protein
MTNFGLAPAACTCRCTAHAYTSRCEHGPQLMQGRAPHASADRARTLFLWSAVASLTCSARVPARSAMLPARDDIVCTRAPKLSFAPATAPDTRAVWVCDAAVRAVRAAGARARQAEAGEGACTSRLLQRVILVDSDLDMLSNLCQGRLCRRKIAEHHVSLAHTVAACRIRARACSRQAISGTAEVHLRPHRIAHCQHRCACPATPLSCFPLRKSWGKDESAGEEPLALWDHGRERGLGEPYNYA